MTSSTSPTAGTRRPETLLGNDLNEFPVYPFAVKKSACHRGMDATLASTSVPLWCVESLVIHEQAHSHSHMHCNSYALSGSFSVVLAHPHARTHIHQEHRHRHRQEQRSQLKVDDVEIG